MNTKVYSITNCPNCDRLKELLKNQGIEFDALDMKTTEAASELFVNSIFTMQAPVLKFKGKFYTNLTIVGQLDINKIRSIIKIR